MIRCVTLLRPCWSVSFSLIVRGQWEAGGILERFERLDDSQRVAKLSSESCFDWLEVSLAVGCLGGVDWCEVEDEDD